MSQKPNARLCGAGQYSILKIRIANSCANTGQSGGFRLIAAANNETGEIIALYIYPKRGPKGIGDISDPYRNELIKEFIKERNDKSLVELDVLNDLAEVVD